jgi:hypothetical protein
MKGNVQIPIALLIAAVLVSAGCSKGQVFTRDGYDPDGGDADADTDSGSGADGDTDADSDGDCDLDVLESFTETDLPEGWHIEDYDGDGYGQTWTRNATDNTTGGEGGYYWVDSTSKIADFDDRLLTAAHGLGDCTGAILSFNHDYRDRDATDSGRVDVQVDEGEWQTVSTYSADASGAVELDLTSYLGNGSSFRVRFRYAGNNDYYWKVDDVRIRGAP